MENVPGFDTKDFGLHEIPSSVVAGFLWINFLPQDSTAEFLEPLANVFAAWQMSDLVVAAELQYVVKANWKLLFQNYSECYHCPTVHPALNRLTPYLGSSNELIRGPILGGPMQLAAGCGTMSENGELIGTVIPSLDLTQQRQVSYFTVFPNIFLSVHPDYALVHRLQRLSNRETEVVCQFLFQRQDRERPNFDPVRAVRFWDLTNRQDWEVCERAQLGMEDVGYRPGPYSNLESVVAAFDRHYLASLGDVEFQN
jgi:Rieske 2Fe-2S family protein